MGNQRTISFRLDEEKIEAFDGLFLLRSNWSKPTTTSRTVILEQQKKLRSALSILPRCSANIRERDAVVVSPERGNFPSRTRHSLWPTLSVMRSFGSWRCITLQGSGRSDFERLPTRDSKNSLIDSDYGSKKIGWASSGYV